jgi:acetyl-CoA decarbonylase/synthase complex subunit gamma
MALKGLDIFKLTPKTNCKDCGNPTCMAFAMKVASGALPIEKCPHMSADALSTLSEATAPPMKSYKVGELSLGGETVLSRHEKTLVSKTLYAVQVCDCMDEAKQDEVIKNIPAVDYERISERMYVEMVYVNHSSDKSPADYAALVGKVKALGRPMVLSCTDVESMKAGVEAAAGCDIIVNGATADNYADMSAVATGAKALLGVRADSLEALHEVVEKLEAAGNKNLILEVSSSSVKEAYAEAVQIRRAALKDGDRTFGYPSIVNAANLAGGDAHLEAALLSLFTCKYGSIVVCSEMTYAKALPLYGLRQNIFTDPQKPMKVQPGIYPINGADENSPCCLTVDFALTYFLVSGEIERSKMPVNLLITDASGMSVLTAWAAGKFSSSSIKKFFDEFDINNKIKNRALIIPGKVAVMKGEIQDKLPEWSVIVGTTEAVQLVKYLRDEEWKKSYVDKSAAAAPAAGEAAAEPAPAPKKVIPAPPIVVNGPYKIDDKVVTYKGHDPNAQTFVTIGERIHCISPVIRKAMDTYDEAPILKRAAEQIAAGATYLDLNIGPAESNGPELMQWAVQLLQQNFDNVPLALDTANMAAIEAGIKVYNRTNGKPIVNSADAGSRIEFINLAAANDAIVFALCSADGIAKDNEERMMHCHNMLERGLALGMESDDLWFDPLFLVIKGMQDKQMDVLNAIKAFSDEGLKSTGGLSNNSNGMPKHIRPIMDSAMVAMAMMQGLTSAIVNPNDLRLMETVKSCDIIKNHNLYADSYLEI